MTREEVSLNDFILIAIAEKIVRFEPDADRRRGGPCPRGDSE